MKSRRFKRSITILTILAMLFLLLPMAVMADDEGEGTKGLPSQASPRAHWVHANKPVDDQDLDDEEQEVEDEEEDEEMGEPGERALFVAERNRQAKEWGLPPGFVNIFDKLSALTGESREDIYTRFTDTESPMWIKDLAMEIKAARMLVETEDESLPVEQ